MKLLNCNCLCSWPPGLSIRPWFPFFLVSWDRMDLWAFMYQKGIAKVSLRVSLWDWRECGKKGTIPSFARKHEWTNCISRYCKVSLLVVRHIAFHGLEPLSRKKSTSQEDSYMKSLAGFSHVNTNKSSGFSFAMWVCNRIYSILNELPSPNLAANAPENRPKLPQRERIEKFQPSIFRCYVAIPQTWISREFHHSILSQDLSDPKRSHVSNLGESVSRPKRDLKSMKNSIFSGSWQISMNFN